MRNQAWLSLFAGLVMAPQVALSSGVWKDAAQTGAWQYPGYGMPGSAQFRPVAPSGNGSTAPAFVNQTAGYRFRPWEGSVDTHRQPQRPFPQQAPVSANRGYQPGWRPTSAPAASAQPATPLAYPARRVGYNTASHPMPGYRFRPLQKAQSAGHEQTQRYRPIQVQIPDRYVFRPLNPVARPTPARRTAPPAPMTPVYAGPPLQGNWPGYAYAPPRQQSRPSYWGHSPYAPTPGYGRSMGYPDPRWAFRPNPYPRTHFPGRNTMPGFRPRSRAEVAANAPFYPHPQFRPHPLQRRYAPGPSYVWRPEQRRFPGYQSPYAAAPRSVYRPPVTPARLNRYGMDWYDGRGDGEGAWYRLTLKSSPTISQTQEPWSVSPREHAN